MTRAFALVYLYGYFLACCAVIGALAALVIVTSEPFVAVLASVGIVAYVVMGRDVWRAVSQ